jgi:hypothetical protein
VCLCVGIVATPTPLTAARQVKVETLDPAAVLGGTVIDERLLQPPHGPSSEERHPGAGLVVVACAS